MTPNGSKGVFLLPWTPGVPNDDTLECYWTQDFHGAVHAPMPADSIDWDRVAAHAVYVTPVPYMARVDSSMIHGANYDAEANTMHLVFNNGSVYVHPGVPPDVFRGFREADFPGRFFAQNIRGKYPDKKLT